MRALAAGLLTAFALAACAASTPERAPLPPEARPAPLFDGLGTHHHPISTESAVAQRYFDQGLALAYGFNHAEAVRSFEACAAHDPGAAMCSWGKAFALGPNIDSSMPPESIEPAWAALQEAKRHLARASTRERAYVEALETRYRENPPGDRAMLDLAFANAMREVARAHPDDLDARTLAAEAAMDTMPRAYYEPDGRPKPLTVELIAMLESVLAVDPSHVGAIHLYIRAVEPSSTPGRAEPYADRLAGLSPGVGHLVHAPSHIYYRAGRYHAATLANQRARAADEAYTTQCEAQGFRPAPSYPHNVYCLVASAMEEGRSELAIESGEKLADILSDERLDELPAPAELRPVYWYTLVRFAKWQDILAETPPSDTLELATAMWHYARGRAYVGLGKSREAEAELRALVKIAADEGLAKRRTESGATAGELMTIARHVLAAAIWAQRGRTDAAVSELETAVAVQDALPYSQPPPWYFPVRQQLGALLLKAGRGPEAEVVYRTDLERNPRNGWSLYGLTESLRSQGKLDDARIAEVEFERAWAHADVEPTVGYR